MSAVTAERRQQLKISEIFHSLQGEARFAGWPTVFIRLTGCPLRCQYCDSEYAFYGGEWLGFDEILDQVAAFGSRHVCVTGGEPLAQHRCVELLQRLCDAGYQVSLETSGAVDVSAVDPRVVKVLDIKTPDSGEQGRNRWENLDHLQAHDMIKFVICSRDDYRWVRQQVAERDLAAAHEIWFSPSHQQLTPRELADWIVADALPVRFQLQMHKYLWGDVPGR